MQRRERGPKDVARAGGRDLETSRMVSVSTVHIYHIHYLYIIICTVCIYW